GMSSHNLEPFFTGYVLLLKLDRQLSRRFRARIVANQRMQKHELKIRVAGLGIDRNRVLELDDRFFNHALAYPVGARQRSVSSSVIRLEPYGLADCRNRFVVTAERVVSPAKELMRMRHP